MCNTSHAGQPALELQCNHLYHFAVFVTAPQVDQPGRYNVSAMYYSRSDAQGFSDGAKMDLTFKVSVGMFDDIKAGTAPTVQALLQQEVGAQLAWLHSSTSSNTLGGKTSG
jgi:hypothetical protein